MRSKRHRVGPQGYAIHRFLLVQLTSSLKDAARDDHRQDLIFSPLKNKGENPTSKKIDLRCHRVTYSPAMRHLPRVHRISIGLLNEITTREETDDDGNVRVHKAATADHKGDLFTKELDRAKFEHALNMILMN